MRLDAFYLKDLESISHLKKDAVFGRYGALLVLLLVTFFRLSPGNK